MQRRKKRKVRDDEEEHVLPGLEQEASDNEGQALAAVLKENTPGKFTKVDPQSKILLCRMFCCAHPKL